MANWQSFRQRDRDIANRLMISESTVKFHINKIVKKLKAQTCCQALHHAIVNGLIQCNLCHLAEA
ncbi:response regulator transcription factor [Trichocoleus sp. FACHB-90]|uniref:LuxR C-terminal-related transcriptional regulator n=1 Tax=Cyanophyceae TaxID=3028117 RepID=UPI0016848CA9|nr:LuxR C-terminal-related transcriptional regulator [Trichocoleus sp. FACHB-90]MBD1927121.1 response regulator transcription factor [Trichocoleus sp. FACHB-90]